MSVFRTDALHMGKTRQDAIPHAHELAIWRLKKVFGVLLEAVDVPDLFWWTVKIF